LASLARLASGKPISTMKKKKSPFKQHKEETTPEATSALTSQEGTCFPAVASVLFATGATRRVDELLLGDAPRRHHPAGPLFSFVIMFTHHDPSSVSGFATLSTSSNASLSLSPGHFVYLSSSSRPVPASAVRPGDSLTDRGWGCRCGCVTSARPSVVTSVTERVGLCNPQTVYGDIYVNGVRAST
jgi:Hint module